MQMPDRSVVLEQLVQQVLRRRKLARVYPGKPLTGIYLEIHNALEDALRDVLEPHIADIASLTEMTLTEFLEACYPKVLSHKRITDLALALQTQSPRTTAYQYALRELLVAIRVSRKLSQAAQLGVPERFYEDVVQDVLLKYVIQRIYQYDAQRSQFMTWVNRQLVWKAPEVMKKLSSVRENALPEGMEGEPLNPSNPPLNQYLQECIEHCSQGPCQAIFEKSFSNRPQATLKAILYFKDVVGETWKVICDRFEVTNLSSLDRFRKRHLPKVIPCLQDCIQDRLELWYSQH